MNIRLPADFSVACPHCGRRNVYQSAAAHPRGNAEETKIFESPRFSTKENFRQQDETNVSGHQRAPMIFLTVAIIFGIILAIMAWPAVTGFIHFHFAVLH
jgi:hypothetical protein